MARLLAIALSVLALTVVFLFAGPQATPTGGQAAAQGGARCYADTDCAAPLWCDNAHGGICRSQCRENRDCTAGQHCVQYPGNIGRCALDQPSGPLPPDAPYCVSQRDCTSGSCNQGQCR